MPDPHDAFHDADPYVLAGVFDRHDIQAWRVGIGAVP